MAVDYITAFSSGTCTSSGANTPGTKLTLNATPKNGIPITIVITSLTIAASTTTCDVTVEASDSATFASGVEVVGQFPQITVTTTASKYKKSTLVFTNRAYLRLKVTNGGALSAGSIVGYLSNGPSD